MAWTCSSASNKGLVSNLIKSQLIRSSCVADAMISIDRGHFTAEAARSWTGTITHESRDQAYADAPISIGYDVTCSAPHMHAYALESLSAHVVQPAITEGQVHSRRILDVGSGSGYLTACLSSMAGPSATVIGIEHHAALVERSLEAIERATRSGAGFKDGWITSGRIRIYEADGRLGRPDEAPFDAIHVGAAAPILPQALLHQLKAPGRMFIPVGTHHQAILLVDKAKDGTISQSHLMDVRYVPLTDKPSTG